MLLISVKTIKIKSETDFGLFVQIVLTMNNTIQEKAVEICAYLDMNGITGLNEIRYQFGYSYDEALHFALIKTRWICIIINIDRFSDWPLRTTSNWRKYLKNNCNFIESSAINL